MLSSICVGTGAEHDEATAAKLLWFDGELNKLTLEAKPQVARALKQYIGIERKFRFQKLNSGINSVKHKVLAIKHV